MKLDLTPGSTCLFNGQPIMIDGMDSPATVSARCATTGALVVAPIAKLAVIPPKHRDDPMVISGPVWERALAAAKALEGVSDQHRLTGGQLTHIATTLGISRRSVQRLRKRFEDGRRVSDLKPGKAGRPKGTFVLSPDVERAISIVIRRWYLRRERASKAEVVRRSRAMCRKAGFPVPSRNAVLRRIEQLDPSEAAAARHGRKKAKQSWEPRPGQREVKKALGVVQIDHTRVDVMVVSDDEKRECIGRPWLTVAIDVATRCIVGIYLSMDAPSSVSVGLCLEHTVLPKPEAADHPEFWPMHGKPQIVAVDNGKDFRSLALMRGCQEHGINLEWRPVATPHYGGHVERVLGTLMQQMHLLPGTTFSNSRERGEYQSEARACMTLTQLRAWLVQKICSGYHMRTHRALGERPYMAWRRLWDPSVAERAAAEIGDPAGFRFDFYPFKYRKIRRTGIELHGAFYWHEDLLPLLNARDEQQVRYDPRDVTNVWVRLPDGRLCEVPAVRGVARPMSLAEHQALRGRTKGALPPDLQAMADNGFEVADAIEDEARRATRAARRAATRAAQPKRPAVPRRSPPAIRPSEATPPAFDPLAPTRALPEPDVWI